jgi:hypothetical protein
MDFPVSRCGRRLSVGDEVVLFNRRGADNSDGRSAIVREIVGQYNVCVEVDGELEMFSPHKLKLPESDGG